MNRLFAIAAVTGLLVGVLVGFLWWGMPTERLQGELGEARKRVEALERQLGRGASPDPCRAGRTEDRPGATQNDGAEPHAGESSPFQAGDDLEPRAKVTEAYPEGSTSCCGQHRDGANTDHGHLVSCHQSPAKR